MSLFSSIRMASNTLQANEIALQVIGQNIANANTPGYIREEIILTPAPTQRKGNLLFGMGVKVDAVVQKIDKFLEERLRGAFSDKIDAETRQSSYAQLEGVIGELTDTDLSSSLNTFFHSVHEILNDVGGTSVRNLAVLDGLTLANDINNIAERVFELRTDLNDRIIDMEADVNRLVSEIKTLNVRIANAEGGDVSKSDAVGLRDQRLVALESLAGLINTRVSEGDSGQVVVYCGSDFLVYEGISREVEIVLDSDRGLSTAEIHLADTDSALDVSSGELAGLIHARDSIMGDFLDEMDDFTESLIFEFNKIYSSGQGLSGYDALTSESSVDATDVALNAAGLDFTPENGSFQVMVRNKNTGETKTTDIFIDLDGLGQDTTLADLAAALNAVDGISASTTSNRRLSISSDSADHEFTFAADTSGTLAALGLNTFFSGSTARSMGVNQVVRSDPAKFAASLGGVGLDTDNAERMAAFLDYSIASQNGASLAVLYDRMIAGATQASSITRAEAAGAEVFEQTLRGQKMAISGVSLDEEAVKMIAYQRSFQASARYIDTLNDLLGVVVSL